MAMASGVVSNISSKALKSKGTGRPFTVWRFEVEGEWYGFGFNKPAFNVGDTIEFDYVDGTYGKEVPKGSKVRQVAAGAAGAFVAPVTAATKPVTAKVFTGKEFPLPLLHPDRCIVRQNMLRHATEIVGQGTLANDDVKLTLKERVELTIKVARELEKYATGYDVVESIEKEEKGE